MRRGDFVTISMQGDFGKPRPALVIQSDRFSEHATVTVLPETNTLVAAPLLRIKVQPWTAPTAVDKRQPHARARSNASGLTPPR